MNEGDTSTGGAQVNPSNTSSPAPTSRPNPSTDSNAEADSVLTISHNDHSSAVEPHPTTPHISPARPTITTVTATSNTHPVPNVSSTAPTINASQTAPLASHPAGQTTVTTSTSVGLSTSPVGPVSAPQAPQLVQPPQSLTTSVFSPQQPVQPPVQPVSTGGGDILLNTPAPKKPKKGLIIGLIILAAVAIVGITLLIAFSLNSGTKKTSPKTAFEQFTSYLMVGESGSEDMSTFDADTSYAIDEAFYQRDDDNKQQYFNQLTQYWKEFADNNEEQEDEKELITEIGDWLSVVDLHVKKYPIPGEEVLKHYLEGGENSVRAYFSEYFNIKEDISDTELQYLYYQDNYIFSLLDVLGVYFNNGCIVGDKADETCIEQKGLYDSGEYQEMTQAAQAIRDYAIYSKDQAKTACGKLIKIRMDEND